MARKRQYGTGQLAQRRKGWVIRWRENEIAPDGKLRRVLRYEQLGPMPRREAAQVLAQRVAAAADPRSVRSRVQFDVLVAEWERTVVPMYKSSTQKNHRHIVTKHLIPRFGTLAVADVTTQTIQAYVAHLTNEGYAPKTIDHIHDVLSAILRTAVKWGHLGTNPARGVSMPMMRTVKPKWALTRDQARAVLEQLPPLARTMVGVALLTGLRRGELFALRWKAIDLDLGTLHVQEAVYEGHFGTPKTAAGGAAAGGRDDVAAIVARTGQPAPAGRSRVRDRYGQADLAEQRPAALGVPGVREVAARAHELADLSTDLLILGPRARHSGQSGRRVDGACEGRHDAERVHASHRRGEGGGRAADRKRIERN